MYSFDSLCLSQGLSVSPDEETRAPLDWRSTGRTRRRPSSARLDREGARWLLVCQARGFIAVDLGLPAIRSDLSGRTTC